MISCPICNIKEIIMQDLEFIVWWLITECLILIHIRPPDTWMPFKGTVSFHCFPHFLSPMCYWFHWFQLTKIAKSVLQMWLPKKRFGIKILCSIISLCFISFILTHVLICPLQSSKSRTLIQLLFHRVVVYFLLLNSRVLGSSRRSDSDVEHVHHHMPAASPLSHAGARLKMPWSVTKGVHRHVLG